MCGGGLKSLLPALLGGAAGGLLLPGVGAAPVFGALGGPAGVAAGSAAAGPITAGGLSLGSSIGLGALGGHVLGSLAGVGAPKQPAAPALPTSGGTFGVEAAGAEKPDRTSFGVPERGELPSGSGLRNDQWGNLPQVLSFGATQGTQGGSFAPWWRGPEGRKTFENAALNYLVDPATGGAKGDVSVLPVMDQYLTNVLGGELDYQPGRSPQAHYLSRLLD